MGMLYPEEAAAELSVGISTLYQLIRKGKVRAVRIGKKCLRVPREALTEYVRGLGE
jgi:excisionase family DNA binding protein